MNFKKIEVFGFKSFADKLEIKFDSGITAIVGPNGCGKSNVADSIRWVLGEQSAKQLRGHSMQDVIFSGTEKRKSLSYCEVSLYFDNTNRIIPLDFNEIVISRKLYRSGESTYAVNRTECRLKDITDLLRDSGMGREGYSIIGQGRIDEILSAKPDDRRAIFEEAAGISKFKSRKTDAERKLGRAKENLLRITDILTELERQLEPLSRQAENARKYLDFKEKLKYFDINTYINQHESITTVKNAINDRLSGIMQEYDVKNKEYEIAINEYTAALNEVNSLDKTIEDLREELLTLTVGLEKYAGEINLLNEKLNNLREQNERLSKDVERYNTEYNAVIAETEEKTNLKNQKSELLKEYNKQLDEVYNKYLAVIDKLTQGEGVVESTQEQVMDAMTRLTDIKSNMSRLIAERKSLLERGKDLSKRTDAINNKITDDEIKAILLSNDIDKLGKEKARLTEQRDTLSNQYNEGQSNLFEHNKYLEDLSIKYNTAAARHKMLADMHNDSQGFSYAVKKLLSDMSINHFLKDKIEGVVARLITVPEKFEAAIETALGNAVQNLVTRTDEDAKYIIEYLKRNNYGRATFLPMSAIKPRVLEREILPGLKRPGCYGVASDLINYDNKYDDIIKGLLGRTVITDDLDIAIRLAREYKYSFKIVTLDGDVINPHGAMSGGSRKSELANILSHERELDKVGKDVENFRRDLLHAEGDKKHLTATQEKMLESVRAFSDKIHDKDIIIATNKEKHDKFVIGIQEQKREIFVLEQETMKVTNRINEIDSDIRSVDELETLISSKKEDAASSMQKHHEESDIYKKERDNLHEEMTGFKVKIAALESGIMSLESELTRLKNNSVDLLGSIEDSNTQILANNTTIESAESAFRSVSKEKTPVDEERIAHIRERLSNLDAHKQRLQSRMVEYDAEKTSLMQIIQNLTDNQYKERSQLEKVDIDLDVMGGKIAEEYQLDYEGCLVYRADNYDLSAGQTEAVKLRRQISALGYVNVNAIEDCKSVGERYSEMSTQRDDLVKAELDLNKIIDELTGEMVSRFEKQFEIINSNFSKIFKELFGGGNAKLILQDSENLLEAGIEIVAEPPGKKLQSISLLSGGERALTAIAILFAILRLKPMPFCVLDEIEAALDDANADRFARYLHRFSQETQFIVITHRKPTMELADSLYGVTMEEKGVSKMVSVKLSDAVKAAGLE